MFAVRIAFLTLQWPGVRMGGIGAAVRGNALALAGAGHDVHVFTLGMPADADRPAGLTFHEVDDLSTAVSRGELPSAASIHAGGEGAYRLALAWRLCQRLIEVHRVTRFDAVEAPEVEALGLPLVVNGDFDVPVVTQLHCCTALAAEFNRAEIAERTLPAMEFAAIHLSDGLIAPTRAVVDATRRLTSVRDDVGILPHAVAEGFAVDLPETGPVVFVGRLERLKGVEVVASALNGFLRECPGATFWFVGPDTTVGCAGDGSISQAPSLTLPRDTGGGNRGHYASCEGPVGRGETAVARGTALPRREGDSLQVCTAIGVNTDGERVSLTPSTGTPGEGWGGGVQGRSMKDHLRSLIDPKLHSRVVFTGELPPHKITDIWKSASFGVMPSVWENFSLAACEAMSAGRALIVAAGTGSVELVGDAGVVVPQGDANALSDAMINLWQNPSKRKALSKAAAGRMRSAFNPKAIARKREAYYAELSRQFLPGRRAERLRSLPAPIAAELLPALVRMTGSLAGCSAASGSAQTPGTRLLGIMSRIESEQGAPAQLLLYGAGKHTAKLMSERHLWESRRHRVVGIIDDHPRFELAPVYLDVPVQSMNAAAARVVQGEKLPPVVLSTDTYADQFWKQSAPLREAGVRVIRLY